MKKLLIAALALGMAHAAQAMDFTGTIGVRNNTWDAVPSGSSSKTQMSFQAGATTMFEMAPQFYLRTGGLYTMRNISAETLGITVTGEFSYLDIPAHAVYAFDDMWSAYAGLNLGLKMGANCKVSVGTCTIADAKSMILPISLGANATFEKTWNVGLFYEMSTEYASNAKGTALGLNGGYMF